MRALLLLYYFPPSGGPGVQRGVKLCRYLPEHGVDPIVVTVRPEVYAQPGEYPADTTLASELDPPPPVVTTDGGRRLRTERLLQRARVFRWAQRARPSAFFERQANWMGAALRGCLRAIDEYRPDVLLTSSQPYVAHLVGREVRRRTGLPWVADFRDPWTWAWSRAWPSRGAHSWEVERETEVLAACDRIVMNTPGSRVELLEHHPWVPERKVHVVRNGYDPADFHLPPVPRPEDEFRVVHSGSFRARPPSGRTSRLRRWVRGAEYRPVPYCERTHSPEPLLQAMLRVDDPRVRLRLVGGLQPGWTARIRELGLDSRVDVLGYRSHVEALAELQSADLLYLPTLTRADHRPTSNVPAKTYEYLGSGRPLAVLCGPGDVRETCAGRDRALLLSPDDVDGLAERLRLRHAPSAPLDPPDAHPFRRAEIAASMAAVLRSAVSSSSSVKDPINPAEASPGVV